MSVYNLQNNNFVALNETSGILQNMTSSNVEYVVCADGDTPTANTGIRINPSKKLKFCQTVGTSYVRVVGNTKGDVIVTPNECSSGGGGGTNTVVFNHIKDWSPNTQYSAGTLVIKDTKLYKCVVPNNRETFTASDWVEIGGGSGSGISSWASDTAYNPNDIVLRGNTLYVCIDGHTSSEDFDEDNEYWMIITDDVGTILPDWKPREKYEKDEIVNVGGFIYRCKREHISLNTFANAVGVTGDEGDWELISWVDWEADTQYIVGQVVYSGGALYKCIANHISDSTSITNDMSEGYEKWVKIGGYELPTASSSVKGGIKVGNTLEINPSSAVLNIKKATKTQLGGVKIGNGIEVANDGTISVKAAINNDITNWTSGTNYKAGQYVIYNNNLYECKTANSDASFDETKWQLIGASGGNFQITDWESGEEYAVGDLVIYNDVLYQCTTANSDVSFDSDKWISIGEPERDLQQWESGKSYKVGHFVIKDNKLYQCTTANSDTTFDATKWTEIGDMSDIQAWESGTSYSADDYVIYDNRVYKCTTANSDTTFTASNWQDMGSIQSYITEWQSGKAYTVGTLVIKDKAIYKCTTANSDLTFTPSKWEKQIDSDKSLTAWASGTSYKAGQYVVYQGKIYECTTANNDVAFDDTKWSLINEATGLVVDSWKTKTVYKKNQIIEYIDDMYMCLEGHTSDIFKQDYDNGLWLKVDHSTPDFKKGSFYAKDSTIIYEGSTYRCVKSHIAWGDSPLEQPALSINYIDPETGNYNYGGIWWYDPEPSDYLKEQIIDLGDYYNVTDFTIRVLVPTGKGSDNITSLALYAMPDNDITSTPTATLFEKTYADDGFYMNTGEKKFEFNAVTCRYLKVVATPTFDNSWGHCVIFVTGYAFGDNGVYWEKIGGAGVVDWEANTNYNTNTLTIRNNILYVCVQDHTSSSSFDTDRLAGKWVMLGGGSGGASVNAIRDVLYSGSDQISSTSGSSTYNLSANLADYDYLVCKFILLPSTTSTNVYGFDIIVKLVAINKYVTDIQYKENPSEDYQITGWVRINNTQNQITLGVREIGSAFSSIYLASVTGIKLVNPNQYSTTEQRIGTWIDGKPLYQKTYNLISPSTANTSTELADLPTNVNPNNLVSIDGISKNRDNYIYPVNSYIDQNDKVIVWVRANGKLTCMVGSDAQTNANLFITIQYTKTTD